MNAAFNVGFIQEQSTMEQLFNRASLEEFHGRKSGDIIDRALEGLEKSLNGLDEAIAKNREMLGFLARQDYELYPEFEAALARHLGELEVNALSRVGKDDRTITTLEDILVVFSSEFEALREMTEATSSATRGLEPQIADGLFVATVLEGKTPFNQAKVSLGFGRGLVETLMSTACHATILAVEDVWPLGFDFLLEPKTEGGQLDPQAPCGIGMVATMSMLLLGLGALRVVSRRSRMRASR